MTTSDDLLSALQWRYATKKFDSNRKIDDSTWQVLEESLVLAPSSFGLQPWKFFVIDDAQIRESLVPASWGQTQVTEASHVVVLAAKNPVTPDDVQAHLVRTAEVRGVAVETLEGLGKMVKGFVTAPPYPLDLKEWATRQVYLALGTFMTSAALLGIDTCPMEGIAPATYDKILGLEGSGYETVVVCCAGFRSDGDKYASLPKVRFPKSQLIQHIS
ncbi:MAG: NAD(P)H-dependent oxidoreductase [Terrimicrobiaceae bacterium]